MRRLGIFLVLTCIALPQMTPPAAAMQKGGGVSEVKVVGIAADVDASTLALNLGKSTGGCKGIPILSMACAGTQVGYAEVCVEVKGTAAGFIPVEATACTGAGGAAFALATGSLLSEERVGHASAAGWPAPRTVKSHKECSTVTAYPKGEPYTYESCHWVYKTVQDPPTTDTEECVEANDWVAEWLGNPTVLPGWHMKPCAGAAVVPGVWDCFEANADGNAFADAWEESDEDSLPGCDGDGASGSGREAASGASDSHAELFGDLLADGAGQPSDVVDSIRIVVPISELTAAEQLDLRTKLRAKYIEMTDRSVAAALEGSLSLAEDDFPERSASVQVARLMAAMRVQTILALDEALERDFSVELLPIVIGDTLG